MKRQYKKSEKSKRMILDAARKLAEEKGFEKMSVQDIVKESGLSVGAFYHHFTGKDEVLNESFLQFDNQLTEEAYERYDRMPALEALQTILVDQALFTESIGVLLMQDYYRVLLQRNYLNAVSPEREYYKAVKRYVRRSQEAGSIDISLKEKAIAEYLIQCVRGAIFDWCLHNGIYSVSDKVKSEMEFYLRPFLTSKEKKGRGVIKSEIKRP